MSANTESGRLGSLVIDGVALPLTLWTYSRRKPTAAGFASAGGTIAGYFDPSNVPANWISRLQRMPSGVALALKKSSETTYASGNADLSNVDTTYGADGNVEFTADYRTNGQWMVNQP
jgi:hypothetical protein